MELCPNFSIHAVQHECMSDFMHGNKVSCMHVSNTHLSIFVHCHVLMYNKVHWVQGARIKMLYVLTSGPMDIHLVHTVSRVRDIESGI
jgi:hypothetical protein